MPIRNRKLPKDLKLHIPELKVSPRDWSLPYQRPVGKKWSYLSDEKATILQQRTCVFTFNQKRSISSTFVSSPSRIGAKPKAHFQNVPEAEKSNHPGPFLSWRTSSSSSLLSPDLGDPMMRDGESEFEKDYLNKKESQRKLTLFRILQHDNAIICNKWHHLVMKQPFNNHLTYEHLQLLVDAIRCYILDESKISIKRIVFTLRKDLFHDQNKLSQIPMSLHILQETMVSVLKSHNIKPHWMFAFDNLIRKAIKVTIDILNSQYGATLLDPDPFSFKTFDYMTSNALSHHQTWRESRQLHKLKEENSQLLSHLEQVQQNFQDLLRESFNEHQRFCNMIFKSANQENFRSIQTVKTDSSSGSPDEKLKSWLNELQISEADIEKFLKEDLRYDDVITLMSRSDLQRLGLRAGPELRIWKAILNSRQSIQQ